MADLNHHFDGGFIKNAYLCGSSDNSGICSRVLSDLESSVKI